MAQMQKVFEAVVNGSRDGVVGLVRAAIAAGESAETILNEGLILAMEKIGELYEQGDLFVPEMLIAAKAMQAGMGEIKPLLVEDGIEAAGKVVIVFFKLEDWQIVFDNMRFSNKNSLRCPGIKDYRVFYVIAEVAFNDHPAV